MRCQMREGILPRYCEQVKDPDFVDAINEQTLHFKVLYFLVLPILYADVMGRYTIGRRWTGQLLLLWRK